MLAVQLSDNQFTNVRKFYPHFAQQNLLTKKGVYCYDYMSSMEKFDETNLPGEDCFYNCLNDKSISKEDYEHAKNVWITLNCKTMHDYHDHNLKSDVTSSVFPYNEL